MALIVKDRVRESSVSTGTGTFTLTGAVIGFQPFSVIGDGNTTYYSIIDSATGAWEVGIGTYTASGSTLSRDIVLESSAAGAKVNFASGTKDVFVTYPADRSVSQADVGTAPNEVPLNQYLGNLAFMSSENAVIDSGRIALKGGGSNLLTYSEAFTPNWTLGEVRIVANAGVAPNGVNNAVKLIPSATSTALHRIFRTLSSTQGTPSVYAKADGYSYIVISGSSVQVSFDLSTGVVASTESGGTGVIEDVGNGWYRCSVVGNAAITSYQLAVFNADNTTAWSGNDSDGILIWGAQLEQSSTVGNYIKTEATAITLENAPGAVAVSIPSSSQIDATYPIAFELASDTSLVVKVKGSDGTVRSATLTLA